MRLRCTITLVLTNMLFTSCLQQQHEKVPGSLFSSEWKRTYGHLDTRGPPPLLETHPSMNLREGDGQKTTVTSLSVRLIYLFIYFFLKSILKSLVILAMWLALSGAIHSRIALSFSLNGSFFSASAENGTVKQNNESDFKAFFTLCKLTNHMAGI